MPNITPSTALLRQGENSHKARIATIIAITMHVLFIIFFIAEYIIAYLYCQGALKTATTDFSILIREIKNPLLSGEKDVFGIGEPAAVLTSEIIIA